MVSKGQKVSFVKCNTTDWSSSVNAFKHAIRFSPEGSLDNAVLFAGTDGWRSFAVPTPLSTRTKSLILTSSMSGYTDLPYNCDFAVSKYGILGLFRSIRSQAHRGDARVNNVVPGYVLTPLTRKVHQIA